MDKDNEHETGMLGGAEYPVVRVAKHRITKWEFALLLGCSAMGGLCVGILSTLALLGYF